MPQGFNAPLTAVNLDRKARTIVHMRVELACCSFSKR
jgi:hypothetical protein